MRHARFTLAALLVAVVSAACSDDSSTGPGKPTGPDLRGTFSRYDTVSYGYTCGSSTCNSAYAYKSPAMAVEWVGGGTFVATGRTTFEVLSNGSVTSSRVTDEVITIQNRPDSTYLETEHGAVPSSSVTANGIFALATDPDTAPCSKLYSTLGPSVTGKTCRVVTRWVRID